MQLEKLIQTIMEKNSFFDKFSKVEMQELLKCCTGKTYEENDLIFEEEKKGREFFIIISGSVLVSKNSKKVDIAREGECIGEMGALSGLPRAATAKAMGKVSMLEINELNINSLHPELKAKLFKNILLLISQRLRKRLDFIR